MTGHHLRILILLALVGITVVGWRWWPASWWLIASAVTVILTAGLWPRQASAGWCCGLLVLATILSPMIAIPWLWPCGLHCQGVGEYATLLGLPTWLWGMLAYAGGTALAAIAWRWPRGAGPWLAAMALCACAGASIYFLVLSWQLAVLCNHCLAIHSVVLTALVIIPWSIPWPRALGIILFSALALHALFHPRASSPLLEDPISEQTTVESQASSEHAAQLEEVMTLGASDAAWTAHLVLDPLCPHCRQAWHNVAETLGPLVGSGDLRIRVRLRHNPRLALSRDLARWTVASAISDRLPQHLPQLIGHTQRVSSSDLQRRWAEDSSGVALTALIRITALNTQAIDDHLRADTRWLNHNRLLTTTTPILLLHGPGVERQVWSDRLPLDDIAGRIAP